MCEECSPKRGDGDLSRRRLPQVGAVGLGSALLPSTAGASPRAPSGGSAGRRMLLRGGTVLTLDDAVGDFVRADVLVDDGRIRAVGPISCSLSRWRRAGASAACGSKTGTLTPGKRADLLLLDATRLNVAPITNATGAVVLGMDTSNVDSVMVDGRFVKRDGRLVGVSVDRLLAQAQNLHDAVMRRNGRPSLTT